jgi:endonuclease-3 related protein
MQTRTELLDVYDRLRDTISLDQGWPGGEWPVSGEFQPVEFEIVAGAVLTQNTSWNNAERALRQLRHARLTSATQIGSCQTHVLEDAIQPAGFFRRKAEVLKELSKIILRCEDSFYRRVRRDELLKVKGIGPETADAILLYACKKPEFVADTYARRILSRYGLLEEASYQEGKEFVESHLPVDGGLYGRFHALLVEHAKQHCRSIPLCTGCVLREGCSSAAPT